MARIARWLPLAGLVAMTFVPIQVSAQQVYGPEELSEMPSVKSVSQAQRAIARSYPRNLQNAGIEGRVQLRFVVGSDGAVEASTIEVVAASQSAFGEAAAAAIAQIEFKPGKKDGSAVRSVVVMPITFKAS